MTIVGSAAALTHVLVNGHHALMRRSFLGSTGSGPRACVRAIVCFGILGSGTTPFGSLSAQRVDVIALLDRYERGEHEAVLRVVVVSGDVSGVRKDLERRGLGWTEGRGAAETGRRRLVAATFALEIAQFYRWPEDLDPLIEWGCQLLRRNQESNVPDRLWFLASVAIYGRARDDGGLVTRAGPGAARGQRLLPLPRAVDHVAHARQRYPDEPRFRFAAAMLVAVLADSEPSRDVGWITSDKLFRNSEAAVRRARASQAIQMFEELIPVPALRAEAQLRIGYLSMILHEPETALVRFEQARDSDDAYVSYLAWFLGGRASDMLSQHDQANTLYRSALSVIPHSQSAANALAANLFLAGKPDEAYALVRDAATGHPRSDDPWHLFGYGDLRLIPSLMSQLREAIK